MLRFLNVSRAEQLLNALFSSSLISHQRRIQKCFQGGLILKILYRFYLFGDYFSNVMTIIFVKYRDIDNY